MGLFVFSSHFNVKIKELPLGSDLAQGWRERVNGHHPPPVSGSAGGRCNVASPTWAGKQERRRLVHADARSRTHIHAHTQRGTHGGLCSSFYCIFIVFILLYFNVALLRCPAVLVGFGSHVG